MSDGASDGTSVGQGCNAAVAHVSTMDHALHAYAYLAPLVTPVSTRSPNATGFRTVRDCRHFRTSCRSNNLIGLIQFQTFCLFVMVLLIRYFVNCI